MGSTGDGIGATLGEVTVGISGGGLRRGALRDADARASSTGEGSRGRWTCRTGPRSVVCLEETGGSLTLPGEVMSVGGDCRYARARAPRLLSCAGLALSLPIVQHRGPSAETEIKARPATSPGKHKPNGRLRNTSRRQTDSGPSTRPIPLPRQRVSTQATHRLPAPSISWDDARPSTC